MVFLLCQKVLYNFGYPVNSNKLYH